MQRLLIKESVQAVNFLTDMVSRSRRFLGLKLHTLYDRAEIQTPFQTSALLLVTDSIVGNMIYRISQEEEFLQLPFHIISWHLQIRFVICRVANNATMSWAAL